jgi:hypothetical protein
VRSCGVAGEGERGSGGGVRHVAALHVLGGDPLVIRVGVVPPVNQRVSESINQSINE